MQVTQDGHAPDIVSPQSKQDDDTQPIAVQPVNVPAPDIVSPKLKRQVDTQPSEFAQPLDKPNQPAETDETDQNRKSKEGEENEVPHLQNYEDFEVEEEGNPNQTESNQS